MIFIPMTYPPIQSVTTTNLNVYTETEPELKHYKILPDLTIEGLDDGPIPEGCCPIDVKIFEGRFV